MKRLSLLLCAASIIASLPSTSAALAENIVFRQTTDNSHDIVGYWSDNVANRPSQNNTTYDNFTLANNTTLAQVQWEGNLDVLAAPVDGFTIDIRTNNSRQR